MKIIYTCPKCGHDLVDVCLCSLPPRNAMYCMNCGFQTEAESEEIVRIPYGGNYHYDRLRLNSSGNAFLNSACDGCSNNPKNGGSGICFCTLGGTGVTY